MRTSRPPTCSRSASRRFRRCYARTPSATKRSSRGPTAPTRWSGRSRPRARRRPSRACFWPLTDTGLAKRLHRITAPTLVAWGAEDRLVPPSYAKRFADALGGPAEIRQIPGAGHMAELDAPEALAEAVLEFLG